MDHGFEMQPHEAPGPGACFSHSRLLGHPTRPSKLPGGASPLIPVLRKTIRLDAFSQSHVPQASGRPGLGARTQSMSSQETGDNLVPRKLSSISLTLRQNSQAWPLSPLPSHWEEAPTLGREAATHGRERLPTGDSPSLTLVPGGRVRAEGPGTPGLAKPGRVPVVEKPLVSSYLALPFQSRLAQKLPGPAVGQGHPVPMTVHVPTRASSGRGRTRSRGIPRPRLHLQRGTPATGPVMAMDLANLETTRPSTDRHLAMMTTNRPSLPVTLATPNTSRLDTGTEFPALVTKVGTAKRGLVKDVVAPDLVKLSTAIATAGTAKPHSTPTATTMDLAAPDPVKWGTARPDPALALVRANLARLDITVDSLALDTSRLGTATGSVVPVTLNPATGETTMDGDINLNTSDSTSYPLTSSRSTSSALGHSTADAAKDLARETKGKCEALGWVRAGLLPGVVVVVVAGPGDG